MGFDNTVGGTFQDVTKLDLEEEIRDFCRGIDPGDDIAFYYCGHGLYNVDPRTRRSTTWLLPRDVPDIPPLCTENIHMHCVSLEWIKLQLSGTKARLKLLLI